jgi:osmotically-inducible protein OsmY
MKSLRPFYVLATILILPGLLPGCAAERKCEAGDCPDDAKITANVRAQINQHSDVGPPDSVQVRTLDHVVYLSGEVSQGLVKQTAEDVARHTPGVTKVVNDIAITK